MSTDLEDLGPIDYLVVEWPGKQPNGEVAPHLIDLVDRGLIRVLDLAVVVKGEDGSVAAVELAQAAAEIPALAPLEGASSGILSDEDIEYAGEALDPGTTAALLVYENSWAAGFAASLRESGAQLVANGRIPVQAFIEALDEAEAATA